MSAPIVADKVPSVKRAKVLGKADLTKFAKMLGKEAEYAINFIKDAMRDEEADRPTRMKAATWIVQTTSNLVKEVDRQTELAKKLELLDKQLEKAGVDNKNEDEDSDDLSPTPAKFTFEIVPNSKSA